MSLSSLLRRIGRTYSSRSAFELVKGLYGFSRWITHPQYRKSVRFCAVEMKKAGLQDVEILEFPIDGKRLYANWKTPYFWNVKCARLDIKINGSWRRFADHSKIPTSVFVYSAPTKGEISTFLVTHHEKEKKGRLVFCDPTDENRDLLLKTRALGIATDFAPNWESVRSDADFRNGHRWENSFLAENPAKLAGFSLSRNQGEVIREALKKAGRLECRFRIDGYLGKGGFLCVTGRIRGRERPEEEVLSVAHLYETGANDNCSGVAASIEALAVILRLMRQGDLKAPSRTIRVVFAFEIVGFLAYFIHARGFKRTYVAGINPDMVGENQAKCRSTLNIYQAPDSVASFINPLTIHLMKLAAGKSLRIAIKKFIINDNSITDPSVGAPCTALIHLRDRFYHSNEDTPDKVSVVTLKKIGGAIAAYLYICASMDAKEAVEIAGLCLQYARDRLEGEAKNGMTAEKREYLLQCELERLHKLSEVSRADLSAFESRLRVLVKSIRTQEAPSSGKQPPALIKKASSRVPVRIVMGPLTFEHMSRRKRCGLKFRPAWSSKWNLPLFWADGKRDLFEIYRLASFESGPYILKDFVEYFELLAKEKLILLKKI